MSLIFSTDFKMQFTDCFKNIFLRDHNEKRQCSLYYYFFLFVFYISCIKDKKVTTSACWFNTCRAHTYASQLFEINTEKMEKKEGEERSTSNRRVVCEREREEVE